MGQSRILVVDDDRQVRELIESVLDDAGFSVESANDAATALARLQSDAIDLVVMDVMLPGPLDGREVIRRARAIHPSLKALFVSGQVSGPVGDDPATEDFVPKPFRPQEFLGCVYELLNRGADRRGLRR